jgi:hypothetical protein
MIVLLLIPGIISFVLVCRGRVATAFLSVYVPSLLLLPQAYSLRIPHLPPLSTAQFALIPIGIVALRQLIRSGSFRFMDALVAMFVASFAITEILREPIVNDGILAAIDSFVSILLAYVAGRRLIEPDLRLETVRRIVILFLLTAPIGLYEWKMATDPYGLVGQKILGIASVKQGIFIRNGHGRLAGSFENPEIVGIALGMAFALNAWLILLNKRQMGATLGKNFSKLQKFHVPEILLVVCIWFTESRGPQMALAVGILILQISRFKNTKLATVVVAVLLAVAALGAQQYFARLTNISNTTGISEQASSALYRRVMNEVYPPIAEMGGWFGWGGTGVPAVAGLKSIDNQYLLVHLVQGRLGYILFVLICAESIRTAIARLWSFRALEDRAFACCMLAALAILWITLYTVYMGEQLPQFAFLLIGWGQSLVPGKYRPHLSQHLKHNPNLFSGRFSDRKLQKYVVDLTSTRCP